MKKTKQNTKAFSYLTNPKSKRQCFGVLSDLPIYKFTWLLNTYLDISLSRIDINYHKNESAELFSFEYQEKQIILWHNKKGDIFYMPQYKHIDYVIVVANYDDFFINNFVQFIKKEKTMRGIFPLSCQ